jgi:hypothetical protein
MHRADSFCGRARAVSEALFADIGLARLDYRTRSVANADIKTSSLIHTALIMESVGGQDNSTDVL